MSTLMDRLRRKHRTTAQPATGPVTMRGGMGEPYCSQDCYDQDGAAITTTMLEGVTGVRCHVCHEPLDFAVGTPTSMVYIAGGPRYFHQTPECDGAVRAEVAHLMECVVCGRRLTDLDRRRRAFEATFGAELTARLVRELGLEPALDLGEGALAAALARWAHRYDDDFLTSEQAAERSRKAAESGTTTVETRAAFLTSWDAQLVAGDASRAAIAGSGLPEDDRDLYLDLAARLYLELH